MGLQIYISEERLVALFIVISFLITFVLTRLYTRVARTRGWGSGHAGDIHVHHLVVGIIFILTSGWAALALDPGAPWVEILGVLENAGPKQSIRRPKRSDGPAPRSGGAGGA